jgi:polyhydroxyalkanoate synthesis repressor PhaR
LSTSATAARKSAKSKSSAHEGAGTNQRRVIKKYPNRRLYDTISSSYITLAEVKQLVLDMMPFVVQDAKTGEDLTRSILLQIILEEETGAGPMFSEAVLANIIRFYGHAMQGFMGSYLEKNVQAFTDMQNRMTEQFGQQVGGQNAAFPAAAMPVGGLGQGMPPGFANASAFGQAMEQSQALFAQMQEQMLSAWGLKR